MQTSWAINSSLQTAKQKVEVVVVTDEIIRVRLAPHGVFLDEFSYAVPKLVQKATTFTLFENNKEFRVSTPVINCHIRKKDFFISFSDSNDNVTSMDAVPMHWEENIKNMAVIMFFAPKYAIPTKVFLAWAINQPNLTCAAKD